MGAHGQWKAGARWGFMGSRNLVIGWLGFMGSRSLVLGGGFMASGRLVLGGGSWAVKAWC